MEIQNKKLKIFVDFDGTIVEHSFPKMGRCNFGCFEIIKRLQDAGHEIILNTYRANIGPDSLAEALRMVNDHHWHFLKTRKDRDDFELKPIAATESKIDPHRFDMNVALEIGKLFIDDYAYGTPLRPCVMQQGNMVDWDALDLIFKNYRLYDKVA